LYDADGEGRVHSSLQIFRNGAIEAVETSLLRPYDERLIIPTGALEKTLIEDLGMYLTFLSDAEMEPPVFLMVSLLGVKGYWLAVRESLAHRPYASRTIDRDAVVLPEEVVEDLTSDPAQVLRPVFDGIWNAAGWPACLDYDEHGSNWYMT
jgi:hypothetical protein